MWKEGVLENRRKGGGWNAEEARHLLFVHWSTAALKEGCITKWGRSTEHRAQTCPLFAAEHRSLRQDTLPALGPFVWILDCCASKHRDRHQSQNSRGPWSTIPLLLLPRLPASSRHQAPFVCRQRHREALSLVRLHNTQVLSETGVSHGHY